MKLSLKLFSLLAAVAMLAPVVGMAQESEDKILIVGQDGQEIQGDAFIVEVDPQDAVRSTFKAKDGKLIVIGKDGKKREIDVSDAQSIVVSQGVKSLMNDDGEKSVTVQGKAIIVGPNGERQEFDLAGPMKSFNLDGFMNMPKNGKLLLGNKGANKFEFFGQNDGSSPQILRLRRGSASKHMIGVFCEEIGDDLRSHLDLEDGVGLIVVDASKDLPADKAGIKKHDILVYADQSELTSIDDLVKAVSKAADKDKAISFGVIRRGKEMSFDIKPVRRPEVENDAVFDFEMSQLGPGIFVEGEAIGGDVEAEIKRMKEEMRKTMEEMKRLQKQMRKRFENEDDDFDI